MISYFIGMKRLDGDDYTIGYEIKRNGKEIELSVPKNSVTDDTPPWKADATRSSSRQTSFIRMTALISRPMQSFVDRLQDRIGARGQTKAERFDLLPEPLEDVEARAEAQRQAIRRLLARE